jgi:hypothetical protein
VVKSCADGGSLVRRAVALRGLGSLAGRGLRCRPACAAEDALDCAAGLYLNDPTAWI